MALKRKPRPSGEDTPYYRTLRGYALDPGFSTQLNTMNINEVIYKIIWENDLRPGPIGEYLEVIDIDPASNCFYDPVDLDSLPVLAQGGLPPSEGNPQFHQQLVYAVIMKTIRHFEFALGRKLIWRHHERRDLWVKKGASDYRKKLRQLVEQEYVQRLRVYPHAFRDSNAYFDQEKMALLFGYFTAADQIQGSNFPGGVVFTCLSPDVIAHEATHAILDALHNRFIEDTNPDVGAFHEGFSDIVALLQRFTFPEIVEHQLASTQGKLDQYSVLGELATQFGQALENERGALRSAIGKFDEHGKWRKLEPDPSDYKTVNEPHDRGAILVATIFDAFQRIYQYRTQDLLRIATGGTGVLPEGSISPDLVSRLAGEACQIAVHLLHICIRALDYCPPFDITFGNYLQALITADLDATPEDDNGYRVAIIEAFRARGIFPDRVNTMSVESLKWARPALTKGETQVFNEIARFLKPEVDALSNMQDRKETYIQSTLLQAELHDFIKDKSKTFPSRDWESLLCKFGLTSKEITLRYDGQTYKVAPPPLEVHRIRPTYRVGREGKRIEQVMISLSQTANIPIRDKSSSRKSDTQTVRFRGGCTMILNLGNLQEIEFAIVKNIRSQLRFEKQVEYQLSAEDLSMGLTTYNGSRDNINSLNFKFLHFH